MAYRQLLQNELEYKKIVEEGTDDEMLICGYRRSPFKLVAVYLLTAATLGFAQLVTRWKPSWKIRLMCVPEDLRQASVLLLKDCHHQKFVVQVERSEHPLNDDVEMDNQSRDEDDEEDRLIGQHTPTSQDCGRYFIHKTVKYVWDPDIRNFKRLRAFDVETHCSDFYEKFHGLKMREYYERLSLYGPNIIDIKVKSYWTLLIEEVLNPFYVFQVASIILWLSDDYYYYAACIFVVSMISICITLYETKKQIRTLRDMVSSSNSTMVTVLRHENGTEEIPSSELVPGDVLIIPSSGCLMACDAVLTAGNCIVNESMLTGESVPETKTPLMAHSDNEIYNPSQHKRHTLFSGTHIIQTRYYGHSNVTAVVVSTGFSTAKGELVRSILFPKPMSFKFYKDSIKFILMLFFLSTLGMAYSIYLYIIRGASVLTIVVRALDIVTIVVPPALPAALTVGIVYAQSRLKKNGIFCISPPKINIAGKLKLMCFDKTGTLTEEGLDLWGIVPVKRNGFQTVLHDTTGLDEQGPLIAAMATCHSLTMINGELAGDPLDEKMFAATYWDLEEPAGPDTSRFDLLMPTVVRPMRSVTCTNQLNAHYAQGLHEAHKETEQYDLLEPTIVKPISLSEANSQEYPYEIGIVRQFPFSSNLQRMSVICRTLGNARMDLYVKGAPEKIVTLCQPSCVPDNFHEVLQNYTLLGFRVIAVAWKPLDQKLNWHHAQRIKREQIECDLLFLGLLIMQNTLKPETTPVIETLHNANIRMVMVTGDNILTALSVARECSLIPNYARVLLANVEPPEGDVPARIKFEVAEKSTDAENSFNPVRESYQTIDLEENKFCLFALDGKAFSLLRTHFSDLLLKLIVKGAVFARMAPEQKTQLVEMLQSQGYIVGMVGDGANDCGALKAADVGISLSEAEASVAAPFTSRISNIECVPTVMKEGRCALVTSFSVFKFIALYSFIQFISVLILYTKGCNLSDEMFLYIDMGITTTLTVVMSNTGPYPTLVVQRPIGSLMNIRNVTSLLFQVILVTCVQISALIYLELQPWYHPVEIEKDKKITVAWETTTIFFISAYQYLTVAVIFSKGPPFRKPFFSNILYVISLLLLIMMTTLLLFNPWRSLADFFELAKSRPFQHSRFRVTLLMMATIHFVLSLAVEMFVVESKFLKSFLRRICAKKTSRNTYKNVETELDGNPHWLKLEEYYTAED